MMDIEFVPRKLRRIDELSCELIACSVFADERPFGGLCGLLDWRFGGRLSELAKKTFLDGSSDEVLIVPGRPHVGFEKVLILGLGMRSHFTDEIFRNAVDRLLRALVGMKVRKAVVELPGRGHEAIDSSRAMELLFESAKASEDHDTWWLVEDASDEKKMRERAKEETRRARQAKAQQE